MMLSAASVLFRRRWATSSCRRSRAISACSALGRPTLGAGRLPGQHAAVTQLSLLGDLGGVHALLTQVRPASALGSGRLVGGRVVELLCRRSRPPCWATTAWL